MKDLRIGLEARLLRGPLTGVGNYTFRTLQAITRTYHDISYIGFGVHSWGAVDPDSLKMIEDLDKAGAPKPGNDDWRLMRALSAKARSKVTRSGYAQSFYRHRFKHTVRRQSLDLFHAFNYLPVADPGVTTLPVVYDLSFVRYPEFHPIDRLRVLEKLPAVLDRAPRVQTISDFSKCEIVRFYGYDADRVFVAPPAAADLFRPMGTEVTTHDIAAYGVTPGSYLLSVGTLEPRKNLRTLISAYSKIPKHQREKVPLIVVGGKGWGVLDLPACTEALTQEGSVRFVGSVSNHQLRSLYEGTIALLYPSMYEGFGMPVVECMACGTTVIHSKKTSMDEITAGLALAVEALDADAWSDAIREVVENRSSSGADRDRLIARAGVFDWNSSAEVVRRNYDALTS